MGVWPLAWLSGSRNCGFCELWCSLQTRLRFHVAVAVVLASSCSSDSTPSLGISICHKCSTKKQNKKPKKQKTNPKTTPPTDVYDLTVSVSWVFCFRVLQGYSLIWDLTWDKSVIKLDCLLAAFSFLWAFRLRAWICSWLVAGDYSWLLVTRVIPKWLPPALKPARESLPVRTITFLCTVCVKVISLHPCPVLLAECKS